MDDKEFERFSTSLGFAMKVLWNTKKRKEVKMANEFVKWVKLNLDEAENLE